LRRRRRLLGRRRLRARRAALVLEAELHVLLEFSDLILELAVLELQLLDLARHLADLILKPVHAHDNLGRVLCGRGSAQDDNKSRDGEGGGTAEHDFDRR
jgi:hypothetical protein